MDFSNADVFALSSAPSSVLIPFFSPYPPPPSLSLAYYALLYTYIFCFSFRNQSNCLNLSLFIIGGANVHKFRIKCPWFYHPVHKWFTLSNDSIRFLFSHSFFLYLFSFMSLHNHVYCQTMKNRISLLDWRLNLWCSFMPYSIISKELFYIFFFLAWDFAWKLHREERIGKIVNRLFTQINAMRSHVLFWVYLKVSVLWIDKLKMSK